MTREVKTAWGVKWSRKNGGRSHFMRADGKVMTFSTRRRARTYVQGYSTIFEWRAPRVVKLRLVVEEVA